MSNTLIMKIIDSSDQLTNEADDLDFCVRSMSQKLDQQAIGGRVDAEKRGRSEEDGVERKQMRMAQLLHGGDAGFQLGRQFGSEVSGAHAQGDLAGQERAPGAIGHHAHDTHPFLLCKQGVDGGDATQQGKDVSHSFDARDQQPVEHLGVGSQLHRIIALRSNEDRREADGQVGWCH